MKLPSATESNRREVLAFLFRADEMSIDSIYNSQMRLSIYIYCLNNWLCCLENIFRVSYSTFPFLPRNETYGNTQISCES